MYKICVTCLKESTGLDLESKEISTCQICKNINIVIEIKNNLYDLVWQEYIRNKNRKKVLTFKIQHGRIS